MKQRMGCSSWGKANVRLLRRGEVKIVGHLKLFVNGKKVLDELNDVTTDFKNKSAYGAAVGTFSPFTGGMVNLICSDVSEYECAVTLAAGGTGAEDYVKYTFSWQNTSGGTKTINTAQFYDDAEALIYCQKTGLTQVVPDQQTVAGEWTITATFDSGGVTDLYRWLLAKMFNTGSFIVPGYINFQDDEENDNPEAAALEAGGTGAENYHQFVATFVASAPVTIDILQERHGGEGSEYTEDDIVDKALDTSEELIGRVRITHN